MLAALAGCGFAPRAAASQADGGTLTATDAALGDAMLSTVAHVPGSVVTGFAATAALTITGVVAIDTDGPTAVPALPAGASLIVSPQDPSDGPELAILEVGGLNVASLSTLSITGSRPLVILSASDITIEGLIDASAHQAVPGPNGGLAGSGSGAGAGGAGIDDPASYDDGGGGGGGFGRAGAAGQSSGAIGSGGAGGASYGDDAQTVLQGGGAGGALAPTCATASAGGGGGAVQLTAAGTIQIDGVIAANGGGGAGGLSCNGFATSAAGGGAGGAIYLQAMTIAGAGFVLAQGGGGGGASDYTSGLAGAAGADGVLTIEAALGGLGAGVTGTVENNDGGNGGFSTVDPPALSALAGADLDNGGGGGGGVGRITTRGATPAAGLHVSPRATND